MSTQSHQNHTLFSPSCYQNKILQVVELAHDIFKICFENSLIANHSQPGQFINIKVSDDNIPLWRRPFSIHRVNREHGWCEILFRLVGKGTRLLSQKKRGDLLNFIGPLGQGFDFSDDKIKTALIVAGGLGIAPLLFLCQFLVQKQITCNLFWGAKSNLEFCCINDFEELNIKMHLATEDGSLGYHGLVTELVNHKIKELVNLPQLAIFSCGPTPMLHRVRLIASENRLPCQVSLETLMACGLGACLGCGVKEDSPSINYLYVCKDGPVFNAHEIDLSD